MSLKTLSIQDLLSSLYQDFVMLQNGTWVPDDDSCSDSLDVIEEIAKRLSVELHGQPVDVDERPNPLEVFCEEKFIEDSKVELTELEKPNV